RCAEESFDKMILEAVRTSPGSNLRRKEEKDQFFMMATINTYRRQNSSSYADAMAGFWFRLHLRPLVENHGRYPPSHRNEEWKILAEYVETFGDEVGET